MKKTKSINLFYGALLGIVVYLVALVVMGAEIIALIQPGQLDFLTFLGSLLPLMIMSVVPSFWIAILLAVAGIYLAKKGKSWFLIISLLVLLTGAGFSILTFIGLFFLTGESGMILIVPGIYSLILFGLGGILYLVYYFTKHKKQ